MSSDSTVRWNAICEVAQQLGIRIRPELTIQLEGFDSTPGIGYAFTKQLLARKHSFTALFAYNDIAAIGAIWAFHEAGLRVPEDISIIGFDDIPGAAYARRRSARRLIFFALVSWGILASLTGVIRNFWLLALDRLLLGAAESFILPAMLILLTNWFTRAERSRTNTILLLGNPVTLIWMSAATGYLIHALGWQMTFIVEGLPAALLGELLPPQRRCLGSFLSALGCGPVHPRVCRGRPCHLAARGD